MRRRSPGFIAARFARRHWRGGKFSAAIKSVAEWFPVKERAFATGLFNSGTNIGAVVAPLVVPWITVTYGWYWAFIATGALGFSVDRRVAAARRQPESHPRVGAPSSPTFAAIRRRRSSGSRCVACCRHRQTWAFAIGKFLTDPIWWLYLFWVPDFLNRNHGSTCWPSDRRS
jgi:ACS family hexuronate transporter-like MFS transporter